MKDILNKNLHFVIILILVVIIGYWYFNSMNSLKDISKNPKYTTALIISDWHHKNNTGIGVDYEYYVNTKKYSNTVNLDLKKGQRYLLVFDSIAPENNVILDIYPMDNRFLSPVNGWSINELPIHVDSTAINDIILENN